MANLKITDYRHPGGWTVSNAQERSRWYCEKLEEGNILHFEDVPFELPNQDVEFLLSCNQSESALHKNVSYRPARDLLRGFSGPPVQVKRVHQIFARYSRQVTHFLEQAPIRVLEKIAGAALAP